MADAARFGRAVLRDVENVAAGARFFLKVPWFVRTPVRLAEARARLREDVASRAARLLDRLRNDIFGRPGSLYHRLFLHAGCQFADVESMVRRDGPEAALELLFEAGICLTVDEFKGRMPVVRGSLRIEARPEDLRSPRAAYHLPASSGGSRSSGTPVLIDFRFVRACAANWLVCADVWQGARWRVGDWETPGAGARFRLLKFAAAGRLPAAWFSQVDPGDPALPGIFRWNIRALRAASAMAGRPLPAPRFAPVSDPTPVARWLSAELAQGVTPLLFTFPASAVRLSLAAAERGIDISGARFLLAGEPVTAARLAALERQGAVGIPRYGSMECGAIGYGCPRGEHPDEVHLLSNMHAVIQAGAAGAALGLPPQALLITNLHPRSPFLMLNVSMGDQAAMRRRDCGCPWAELGLRTTLSGIRSFEKLTGGGVTFFGTEVVPILEDLLPARFGGAPTDYQLVEEEAPDGQPLLFLVVHPSLGTLDTASLADFFLTALGEASASSRMMAQRWRDANILRVARRSPSISPAGKILHLHVARRPG